MIVREIAEHPELVDDFDWFNDYDDTRRWAKHSCPEMVGLLDYGFRRYKGSDRYVIVTEFGDVFKTSAPLPKEIVDVADLGYIEVINITNPENPKSLVGKERFKQIPDYVPVSEDEE